MRPISYLEYSFTLVVVPNLALLLASMTALAGSNQDFQWERLPDSWAGTQGRDLPTKK